MNDVKCTPSERIVLDTLLKTPNQPVSQQTLVDALYLNTPYRRRKSNTIEVFVKRLRTKLAPHKVTIRTRRGVGYVLETIASDDTTSCVSS